MRPDMPRKKNDTIAKSAAQDAAWQRVKATTKPLTRRNLLTTKAPPAPDQNTLPDAAIGAANKAKAGPIKNKIKNTAKNAAKNTVANHKPHPIIKPAAAPQPRIEARSLRRLARGILEIDATLDLHGLTLTQAEAALAGFIARQAQQRAVWVLVITGKGARGEGKLRAALPDWLAAPKNASRLVEYGPASIAHGGSGAFYLRLRKMKL